MADRDETRCDPKGQSLEDDSNDRARETIWHISTSSERKAELFTTTQKADHVSTADKPNLESLPKITSSRFPANRKQTPTLTGAVVSMR